MDILGTVALCLVGSIICLACAGFVGRVLFAALAAGWTFASILIGEGKP